MKTLERLKLHNLEAICVEDQKTMLGGSCVFWSQETGWTNMLDEVTCYGSSSNATYGTITCWGGTARINSDGSLMGFAYENSPEMQAIIDSANQYTYTIGNTEYEKFLDWKNNQPSANVDGGVTNDAVLTNLAWQLWQWIRN